MIVENQKIEIKWSYNNKEYYSNIKDSEGNYKYAFTKIKDVVLVDFEDVLKNSKSTVLVKCDYCNTVHKKTVGALNVQRDNNEIKKDCCKKCSGMKVKERFGNLEDDSFFEDVEKEINIYTEEDLISNFKKFYEEFGKYPRLVDLKNNKNYIGATPYNRLWGNYNKFLNYMDLIGENNWFKNDEDAFKEAYNNGEMVYSINNKLMEKRNISEMQEKAKNLKLKERNLYTERKYDDELNDIEKLELALLDLYNDVGKIPNAFEFDHYLKVNKLPSRRLMERKVGKPYSKICEDLLGETNKMNKTNNQLITELTELKVKLGRPPFITELKEYGLADMKTYTRRFNMKYVDLITSLGWDVNSTKLKFKSKEEMLFDFNKLYEELNRIPDYKDINDCEYTVSYNTYNKYFGSIYNILDLLEIQNYILDKSNTSAGIVCLNNNNEMCRSLGEMEISNMMIGSQIKYLSEIKYNKFDQSLKNKWIMDWYLVDYDIYVEYFGMYSESNLNKKGVIGNYSRKTMKKMAYCRDNNLKLISIFPSDLENGYKGMLDKFLEYDIKLIS